MSLRVSKMKPLNRGCVEQIVIIFDNEKCEPIDKTNKAFFLTAKKRQWDLDKDDKKALFKVKGVIRPEEPNRVAFSLSEKDTYLDADKTYFCDIVEVDKTDETSNPRRVFLGSFDVIGGANNKEAGEI